MGYDVTVEIEGAVIPADKVPKAIAAVKELMSEVQQRGGGGSFAPGKPPVRHYAWVDTQTVNEALERGDLKAVLEEWRYSCSDGEPMTTLEALVEGHQHRAVVIDYFSGGKLGDDEWLWRCLAPFLPEGAVVTFRGEDDAAWRYIFEGESLREETGTLVWE
jgi:hypothetical protein